MDTIILVVVVGIIIGCALEGRHKGLVHTVLTMVATVVAIMVASVLTRPICDVIIDKIGLFDEVVQVVSEAFSNIEIEDASYIEEMEIPDVLKDKLREGIDDIDIPVKDYVIERIASVALSSIVFIVIYTISIILLRIVISMTNLVVRLPLIAQANRGAGLVAGMINGVVVVWVAMIVLTALSGAAWSNEILLIIGNNELLSAIYDSNPIMNILANII